jgi:LysM repeat protein
MIYVIQKGDTLSQIADKFGVDMHELARINGIRDINRIYAGEDLIIPQAGLLTVPEIWRRFTNLFKR